MAKQFLWTGHPENDQKKKPNDQKSNVAKKLKQKIQIDKKKQEEKENKKNKNDQVGKLLAITMGDGSDLPPKPKNENKAKTKNSSTPNTVTRRNTSQ